MAETSTYLSSVDRRRTALVTGICGQADRILVKGQVVDIPVMEDQLLEQWHPETMLPPSMASRIRPVQDMGMTNVRRARLQIEIIASDQQPYETASALVSSEIFRGNDDSFFEIPLPIPENGLAAGDYLMRIMLRGIDSIRQSVTDLTYISGGNSHILKKDIAIGFARLTILPDDFNGFIITSDIDQTFLDTKIESRQGLMETLFETPDMKHPFAGMVPMYRAIPPEIPLNFISASPHFFRRTFLSLFAYYDLQVTGLHLKYLIGALENIVKKGMQSLWNLEEYLAGGLAKAVERSVKFMGSSLQSLFDQVPYKLTALLENRSMHPTGAREILLGDNTESDFFIFFLYQSLLLGKLRDEELRQYLYHLRFRDREAMTRDAANKITELVEKNLQIHGKVNPVASIIINMADPENNSEKMIAEIKTVLPDISIDSEIWPAGVPGTAGFVLHLYESGIFDQKTAQNLLQSVRNQKVGSFQYSEDFLTELISSFNASSDKKIDLKAEIENE